ncbi:hypothetical protein Sjap_014538 [Stephania japonica]|uniref:Uncharacterized protein n=1 Tax=Stephania japonica TaxID=461633 RepID=A0AAP0IIX1_9MAGN
MSVHAISTKFELWFSSFTLSEFRSVAVDSDRFSKKCRSIPPFLIASEAILGFVKQIALD